MNFVVTRAVNELYATDAPLWNPALSVHVWWFPPAEIAHRLTRNRRHVRQIVLLLRLLERLLEIVDGVVEAILPDLRGVQL